MHGGVRNMKGERQMIYKNITFEAAPFSYDLTFDDRITLVGGDSGTGKTVLYEMLEDIRLTEEYKAIKLFNYKSDDFLEAIKQCRNSFIVIDNADCLINDDVDVYKRQVYNVNGVKYTGDVLMKAGLPVVRPVGDYASILIEINACGDK